MVHMLRFKNDQLLLWCKIVYFYLLDKPKRNASYVTLILEILYVALIDCFRMVSAIPKWTPWREQSGQTFPASPGVLSQTDRHQHKAIAHLNKSREQLNSISKRLFTRTVSFNPFYSPTFRVVTTMFSRVSVHEILYFSHFPDCRNPKWCTVHYVGPIIVV